MKSAPILLKAQPVADALRARIGQRVKEFKSKSGRSPKISVVLIGDDPASVIYTSKKGAAAQAVGMEHETIRFAQSVSPESVHARVEELNEDPSVDGILIQRPTGGLPLGFREEEVLYWVSPEKDVDAFHPENLGRLALGLPGFAPCTPAGVMEILKYYKIPVAGKLVCILGRSPIVGKPMAMLMLQHNATILHAHSQTPDVRALSQQADLVIAAIGRPEFVDSTFLKDGSVLVDVGINRRSDGKVVGDANFEDCSKKVSAITPVPGGVGPMTIAVLLQNTIFAAEQRLARSI